MFDFSDHAVVDDYDAEYTKATLGAGSHPESVTICSPFMMWDYWTTEFKSARLFTLLDKDMGWTWAHIELYAGLSFTKYQAGLGPFHITKNVEGVFFPL